MYSRLSWVPLKITALPDTFAADKVLRHFFSDSGSYDKKKCRLLKWHTYSQDSACFTEFGSVHDSFFDFKPGCLFWLKAYDSSNISFGKAQTISLNDTFSIFIPSKSWVDFSIPFYFPVELYNVFSATESKTGINISDSLEFYFWKKSGSSYITEPLYLSRIAGVNILDNTSLSGVNDNAYSVYNAGPSVTMYIPPVCSVQMTSDIKKKKQHFQYKTAWSVKAKCSDSSGNCISVLYCAGDENAVSSTYYPVMPTFSTVSVSIIDSITGKYCGGILKKNSAQNGSLFKVIISNNSCKKISTSIFIDTMINIPKNIEAQIICPDNNQEYSVSNNMAISLNEHEKKNIYIAVGTEDYIDKTMKKMSILPGISIIYPNPFHNRINIKYVVPYSVVDEINFDMEDLHGRCIWRHIKSKPNSGENNLIIQQGNFNNKRLAPGIYILRYNVMYNKKTILKFCKSVLCI
jgi:hypothetical protein